MSRRNRIRIPMGYEDSSVPTEYLIEKQKVRLDIEIIESLKARYRNIIPLSDSFSHIIKLLKDELGRNSNAPSNRNFITSAIYKKNKRKN